MLHEPLDIAKSKQFRNKGLGREPLQILEVFADTKEDDGCLGRCDTAKPVQVEERYSRQCNSRRNSASTLCMTIHLSDNDRSEVGALLESATLSLGRLA